jgi:hypothetical protein
VPDYKPEEYADRDAEKRLFFRLVRDQRPRILTITDGPGTGKSHLLVVLQHWCEHQMPQIPVSRVVLADVAANRKSFDAVTVAASIADDLAPFDLEFKRFRDAHQALETNARPALNLLIDLSNADLSHANDFTVTGISAESVTITRPSGPPEPLTVQEREHYSRGVLDVFGQELQSHCGSERPIVLLLDTAELLEERPAVSRWVREFLARNFFNPKQSARIVLVMAGKKLPDFRQPAPAVRHTVVRRNGLTPFSSAQSIQEAVRRRYPNVQPTPEQWDLLSRMASERLPVLLIVGAMESWWKP